MIPAPSHWRVSGAGPRYERDGAFDPVILWEHLSEYGAAEPMRINGDLIDMTALNYRVFSQRTECVTCGLKGQWLVKERSTRKNRETGEWESISGQRWHFNLYGLRERDGAMVMLTKDHICPRSKGGTDELYNLQTMCQPCNQRKADRY